MMDPQNVLVIGPAWVGDMVMAQTLFKMIKQRSPNVNLDVMAPAWSQPLLERMPEVNRGLVSPFKHGELCLRERYKLGKKLRDNHYDQAIVLPNSYKSALVPYWAKIPLRTGWLGEKRWGLLNDVHYLNKKQYPLMIQRFVALGLPQKAAVPDHIAMPRLVTTQENTEAALQRLALVLDERPILALCPGAEFGPSKRWSPEYYAELANAKLREGWRVWLFGSAKDRLVTDVIQAATDERCENLAGKTTLAEAIDLLALAECVVTNDSGLMHIANAVGRKTIVIYGSSSPGFTPPLSSHARIIKSDIECSPCFKRQCPLKHHRCMLEIKPQQVLKEMDALLAHAKPSAMKIE